MAVGREAMPRIAIRLPNEMLSKLETPGTAGGRGVGEEIRRRVADSLAMDSLPPETQRLLEVLHRLLAGNQFRDWHRSPELFKIFKQEALSQVLDHFAPKKDATGLLSGAQVALARGNPRAFAEVAVVEAIATAAEFLSNRSK